MGAGGSGLAGTVSGRKAGSLNQFVQGNQSEMLSALQSYVVALRQKRAAMCNLQEISGQLLKSITIGDTGSLADTLDARAAACRELGRLLALRPAFDLDLNSLANAESPGIKKAVAEIMEGHSQLESLRIQTLAMQSECEEALRSALAATAKKLAEVSGHRKVRSAYFSQPSGPSRFVDKKK